MSRFPDNKENWLHLLQWIFWPTFVLVMILYALNPIADPDFWWHLRTGQLIVEGQALPASDPFSLTTAEPTVDNDPRATVILRGYWLWQVVAYLLYLWQGLNGIALLKVASILAIAAVVVRRMQRLAIRPGTMMLFCVLGLSLFAQLYFLERPQIFSFLFAAILLGLFEEVREKGRLPWLLIPLMALWGNCHGGVVVGDIFLVLFMAGMLWEWRQRAAELKRLLLWGGAGIAASLLQPNGYLLFSAIVNFNNDRQIYAHISEYDSAFKYFTDGDMGVVALGLIFCIHLAGLVLSRRRWLPDCLIFAFTAWFALSYGRNIAFYVVALLPAAALYAEEILPSHFVPRIAAVVATVGIVVVADLGLYSLQKRELTTSTNYPQQLADFLQSHEFSGQMLNEYSWGGYLLWRLSARYKVFIDGRGLSRTLFFDYQRLVQEGDDSARQNYDELLDRHRIEWVVFPHYHGFGTKFPLLKHLLQSGRWQPVYADDVGYVLVRRSSANSRLLERDALDERVLYQKLLASLSDRIRKYPKVVDSYISRGELLSYLGSHAEAEDDFSNAERISRGSRQIQLLRRTNQLAMQEAAGETLAFGKPELVPDLSLACHERL